MPDRSASLDAGTETGQAARFPDPSSPWWVASLAILTLVARLACISVPYFVDGPSHIRAIESGHIFIQPPGYFLFAEFARWLSVISQIPPASAISCINIGLNVCGVVVFSRLAAKYFPGHVGLLLAFCYAFSDTVWFVSDVHSTYASMTFFAPAILYAVAFEWPWWAVGLLWASMTGFRPSDGVFVFPFILFTLWKRKPGDILQFSIAAVPVFLLWYVPTVIHFGGGLLSPLSSSGGQASGLAQGLLTRATFSHKAATVIRLGLATLNAWNILVPFVAVSLFSRKPNLRPLQIWVIPGLLFFSLYFFSDSSYLAYMIAPGMLLAGEALKGFKPRVAMGVLAASLTLSVLQIMVARPIESDSPKIAVLNSYTLQYTRWALQRQYHVRLQFELNRLKG